MDFTTLQNPYLIFEKQVWIFPRNKIRARNCRLGMDFESIKSILEFAGLGMDFMFSPPCIGFGYGFIKSGYGFCYFGKSILRFLKSRYGFCKVIKSIPEKQNPYWGSSRGVNFGRKKVFQNQKILTLKLDKLLPQMAPQNFLLFAKIFSAISLENFDA